MCLFHLSQGLIAQGSISGELRKWHRVTILFDGPNSSENANPNPFLDYRLNVTFTAPSGNTYVVPGFYAADGNAAETSAASGNKWAVHFTPDETGSWSYGVSFRTGADVAISLSDNAGTPISFDGAIGSFQVSSSNKVLPDNRSKGRLSYVSQRYLQFEETGTFFLKAGADSPENLLAFGDIDNTINAKTWSAHLADWNPGDPVWQGDKGKGLIGAINYLSGKGMNAFSFNMLTLDDLNDQGTNWMDVWPFASSDLNVLQNAGTQSEDSRTRYDVSKLAQWEILFDHADAKGMFLHFKMQDTKNERLLDAGQLGVQRRLYYREIIARFGHHLALNWNLGEEFTLYQPALINSYATYIKEIDPHDHHIVIHSFPFEEHHERLYRPLLGPNFNLTGASMQVFTDEVHETLKNWISDSKNSGKQWVISYDEQAHWNIGVAVDENHSGDKGTVPDNRVEIRDKAVWGTLMAGASGSEYYFGRNTGQNDREAEDWRSRESKWEDAKIGLDFFNSYLNFWEMETNDQLTTATNDYCFAKPGEIYAIYLPTGGSTDLDLSASTASFTVGWYNPRSGGSLLSGSVTELNGGANRNIGIPPSDQTLDWVVLVKTADGSDTTVSVTGITTTPSEETLTIGDEIILTSVVAPSNATNTNVVWSVASPSIATVDSNGRVVAVSPGTTLVTAETVDGGYTDTSIITVESPDTSIPVESVIITPEEITLNIGDEITLNAEILPSNATNSVVIWTTGNASIALVNENGTVSAISDGTVSITAQTVDGGFTDSAEITVLPPRDPPENITISSITLVNADSDIDLFTLSDGLTIDSNDIVGINLNIRANTQPEIVGSVSFDLSGPISNATIENTGPYTLFGIENGDYSGNEFLEGEYTLEVIPYSESDANGNEGELTTIRFIISDSTVESNQPPTAMANGTPMSGEIPLEVKFDSTGSFDDDTISHYLWDFGNGITSDEENPSYTYTTEGVYEVTLEVTDNKGLIDTDLLIITASTPEDTEGVVSSEFEGVLLYPQPAEDFINIHINNTSVGILHMYVYNLGGNLIASYLEAQELITDEGTYKMDISDLPSGVYIVKAYTDASYSFLYKLVVRD